MPTPIRGKDTAPLVLRLAPVVAAAAVLLLAASSCRLSPLAPVRDVGESAMTGYGNVAALGDSPQVPPLGVIDIAREGDRVRFSIGIIQGGQPGPDAPSRWTFRLHLDVDQDLRTGDDEGTEVTLVAAPEDRIEVWRHEPSGWRQTQTAPMTRTGSRIAFELPASALAEDDGLVDYALDLYEIRATSSGLRFLLAARYAGRSDPVPDERTLAPAVTRLRSEVRHGTLYLTGRLDARNHRADLEYTPYRPGGWCLQVFLNTDRQLTGYWLGFDYIVRGVEWNPANGASIVRRITLEPGYPGGWGPASGEATLLVGSRSFNIAIPLAAIGGTSGDLDFAMDTYTTVACPGCESGYTQEFSAVYFGRSSTDWPRSFAADLRPTTRGPARREMRPGGARSAPADRAPHLLATTR